MPYVKIDDQAIVDGRRVDWSIREPIDHQPSETLLIVPGIMAKRRAYDRYARRLSEAGIRSVTMSHETGTMFCSDEVADLKNRLADKYSQPVRLVGHSLGGIHATEAASKDLDGVSGLLLLQPAGFGGVQPARALESILRERSNSRILDEIKMAADGLAYAIKGGRNFAGTVFRASTSLREETLAAIPDDVDRDAITFAGDKLIDASVARLGLKDFGFDVVELGGRAGHNAQYYQAEAVSAMTSYLLDCRSISAS